MGADLAHNQPQLVREHEQEVARECRVLLAVAAEERDGLGEPAVPRLTHASTHGWHHVALRAEHAIVKLQHSAGSRMCSA